MIPPADQDNLHDGHDFVRVAERGDSCANTPLQRLGVPRFRPTSFPVSEVRQRFRGIGG